MNILLTNDDGIYADGLWALYRAFAARHTVAVIAPDRERSAVGHGLTLSEPIRADSVHINENEWGYAVSGTPVDCIKLGILELLDFRPDLVVSGINPGINAGVNLNYSGTVAAAKEASLYRIPSIAASIQGRSPVHYDGAAAFIVKLAAMVLKKGLPPGSFLNINFPDKPADQVAGVRISRQGTVMIEEYIEKKTDPRHRTYYWHGAVPKIYSEDSQTDSAAVSNNFISITPVKCDMTDLDLFEDLKSWGIDTP